MFQPWKAGWHDFEPHGQHPSASTRRQSNTERRALTVALSPISVQAFGGLGETPDDASQSVLAAIANAHNTATTVMDDEETQEPDYSQTPFAQRACKSSHRCGAPQGPQVL